MHCHCIIVLYWVPDLPSPPVYTVQSFWSSWSAWSVCSASCGGGRQQRTRRCVNGNNCVGRSTEFRDCNSQLCPQRKYSSYPLCVRVRVRVRVCVRVCVHVHVCVCGVCTMCYEYLYSMKYIPQ